MRKTILGLGCALLATATLSVGTAVKADDKKNDFEAYSQAGKPGAQHKLLESMAGTWTFTAKMWMAPNQPPEESTGTVERKMLMGGRFLQEDVTGSVGGIPFHGMSVTGYDNAQGKFVGTWIDSMGTGITHTLGTADATGKVLTYEREEFDPIAKAKTKGRDVLHLISNDKEILEFNKVLPDGKEFKMMEIVYTRKK
jgi:hypothetical protein